MRETNVPSMLPCPLHDLKDDLRQQHLGATGASAPQNPLHQRRIETSAPQNRFAAHATLRAQCVLLSLLATTRLKYKKSSAAIPRLVAHSRHAAELTTRLSMFLLREAVVKVTSHSTDPGPCHKRRHSICSKRQGARPLRDIAVAVTAMKTRLSSAMTVVSVCTRTALGGQRTPLDGPRQAKQALSSHRKEKFLSMSQLLKYHYHHPSLPQRPHRERHRTDQLIRFHSQSREHTQMSMTLMA